MKNKLTIMTLLILLSNSNNYAGSFIEDFDNLVKESTNEFFGRLKDTELKTNKVNAIFETKKDNKWGIELNIPGYKKDEIKITINKHGYLNIKAEANKQTDQEKKDQEKNYLYKNASFSSQAFSQTIKLPKNIDYKDASKIDTSYDEKTGILEIKFPKKEIGKTKKDVIELKLK